MYDKKITSYQVSITALGDKIDNQGNVRHGTQYEVDDTSFFKHCYFDSLDVAAEYILEHFDIKAEDCVLEEDYLTFTIIVIVNDKRGNAELCREEYKLSFTKVQVASLADTRKSSLKNIITKE